MSHVLLKMRKASKSAAIVLVALQSTRSQQSDAFKNASRSINCTNLRAETARMHTHTHTHTHKLHKCARANYTNVHAQTA